jgi:hypothetical protein
MPALEGEAELALGKSIMHPQFFVLTPPVRATLGNQDKYDLNRAKKDESTRRRRFDDAYKKNTKKYGHRPDVMKKLQLDFEAEEAKRHEWDLAHRPSRPQVV